jgi:hypothetical protein
MSSSAVRRPFGEHWTELRACYEQARASRPDLRGRMIVQMTIGTDGRASPVNIDPSLDAELDACWTRAIGTFSFQAPAQTTSVRYPFDLGPS